MRLAGRFGSTLNQIIQADTIAAALLDLDRCADAAYVLAVCELVHDDLWVPASGPLHAALERARLQIAPDLAASARARVVADGRPASLERIMGFCNA